MIYKETRKWMNDDEHNSNDNERNKNCAKNADA